MNLAQRARRATGLSQRAFGLLIGVSHVTVANWERGRHPPAPATLTLLQLIAKRPEVCVSELREAAWMRDAGWGQVPPCKDDLLDSPTPPPNPRRQGG